MFIIAYKLEREWEWFWARRLWSARRKQKKSGCRRTVFDLTCDWLSYFEDAIQSHARSLVPVKSINISLGSKKKTSFTRNMFEFVYNITDSSYSKHANQKLGLIPGSSRYENANYLKTLVKTASSVFSFYLKMISKADCLLAFLQ